MRERRPGIAALFGFSLAALAVDLVGTYVLSWGEWQLGAPGHWSEGFDETLVWGGAGEALRVATDYIAWAPLFEELAFRGVLYLSLRRRFGAFTAAVASAALFGALHFYSLPGFLGTLWSGLVWAFVLCWYPATFQYRC